MCDRRSIRPCLEVRRADGTFIGLFEAEIDLEKIRHYVNLTVDVAPQSVDDYNPTAIRRDDTFRMICVGVKLVRYFGGVHYFHLVAGCEQVEAILRMHPAFRSTSISEFYRDWTWAAEQYGNLKPATA